MSYHLHARPNSPVNVTQHAYDYSKADFLGMNAYIFNSNTINCLHFTDVETTWAFIKSIIYDAMMLFIPKFLFHSKQYPKWLTKDLRHQLKTVYTPLEKLINVNHLTTLHLN